MINKKAYKLLDDNCLVCVLILESNLTTGDSHSRKFAQSLINIICNFRAERVDFNATFNFDSSHEYCPNFRLIPDDSINKCSHGG